MKPHKIWLYATGISLGVGLVFMDNTLAINIHDTYIIIDYLSISVLFAIWFGIMALGYWLVKQADGKLYYWLTLSHITLTFGGIILMVLTPYVFDAWQPNSGFPAYDSLVLRNSVLVITLLIIALAQLLFFVIVSISIFRFRKL